MPTVVFLVFISKKKCFKRLEYLNTLYFKIIRWFWARLRVTSMTAKTEFCDWRRSRIPSTMSFGQTGHEKISRWFCTASQCLIFAAATFKFADLNSDVFAGPTLFDHYITKCLCSFSVVTKKVIWPMMRREQCNKPKKNFMNIIMMTLMLPKAKWRYHA